jgi:hypothetical protein
MPFHPITAPAQSEPTGLAAAEGAGLFLNPPDPLISAESDWLKGYALTGDPCLPSHYLLNPRQCDDNGDPIEDIPDTVGWVGPEVTDGPQGYPFVVGAGVQCGTFTGAWDLDRWQAMAQRGLELVQWADIADELWTGDKAQLEGWPNKFLASSEADVITGTLGTPTAVGTVDALGEMDSSFASCMAGGPRLIHATRRFLVHAKAKGAVERVGSRYFTPNGSLLVVDDGYDGTGPQPTEGNDRAANAAGTTWIYGTGPVLVRWTGISFPQGDDAANYVDYRTNHIEATAQRQVMATWQCCTLAALVNLTA